MSDDWPETVQEAILWHHEAEVAAVRAKRAHALLELDAYVRDAEEHPGATRGGRAEEARVTREIAESRAALDLAELEEQKRWRWVTVVIAREGRR